MAKAIAERIIERLSSLDFQEIRETPGIKNDVERLKNKVQIVKDIFSDAEEQQAKDRAVGDWLEKVKDVIYDADNLLDDFTEDLQSKVMTGKKLANEVRSFFSKSNRLANRTKIDYKKIKEIIDKLDTIANEGMPVPSGNHPVGTRVRDTDPFVGAEAFIGRGADKEAIIRLLLDSNVKENVSIIPIVGQGGLGKTTLAQFVYNDDIVKKDFHLRMWVCVSDPSNLKNIVKDIIKSAANKNIPENLSMYQLKNHLQQEINGKKYLLVLDDVWFWDIENWHSLKSLLVCGAWGSRILITTPNEEVAKFTGTVAPHMLSAMNSEDSWSLFKQIAFKHGQGPKNSRILEIGREIVGKCEGHPLSIRVIGGILYYFEDSESDWLSLKNNALWEANDEFYILPALKLSYIHLPSHFRGCFTYCALFPEDHKIDVQTLIYLWVAQGFICSSDASQCPEDVGYDYFMNLLHRSFFQEVEKDEWGNIKSCKMHNLMSYLAFCMVGVESALLYSEEEDIDQKTRHVSLGFNLDSSWKIRSQGPVANRIRTFLLPCQSWASNEEKLSNNLICDAIISTFMCLRVLDLHDLGIVMLPSSLGKLKHLRYLDLSGNGIEMLPSSINKLQKLQTLKLCYCRELKELPKDIDRLLNLRHLVIDGCRKLTHMPRGLGQLTSLQTLTQFVVSRDSTSSANLSELSNLNNLRGELEILHLQHLKDSIMAANLKEKSCLQVLSLEWDDEAGDCEKSLEGLQPHPNLKGLRVRGYRGVKFIPSLVTNIVKFTLFNCPKCQYLPPFHQFRSLKILELLRLYSLEYVADSDDSSSDFSEFFPSLAELKLWDCPELKRWWRSDDVSGDARASFRALSKLEIMYCPNLNSVPSYPHLKEQLILSVTRAKPLLETVMNVAAPQGPITELASTSSSSAPLSSFHPRLRLGGRFPPPRGMVIHRIVAAPQGPITEVASTAMNVEAPQRPITEVVPTAMNVAAPLSSLRLLRIEGSEELESLPEQWLRNLTSLERLDISECPKLEFLSKGIQHLTSLRNLDIRDCEALALCSDKDEGMQWKDLRSLRSLTIWEIPNLSFLPAGLQHVTTLETLNLSDCPNLEALPEWIGSLASLRRLVISECYKLASLPEGISKLKSLRWLVIDDCPILLKRCQRETGEDWPKIAHIPFFEENATYVDSD